MMSSASIYNPQSIIKLTIQPVRRHGSIIGEAELLPGTVEAALELLEAATTGPAATALARAGGDLDQYPYCGLGTRVTHNSERPHTPSSYNESK